MGIKDKVKKFTAREESTKISKGEIKEKHLGKYTPVMLEHYIQSLKNTKPAFRDEKWEKQYNEILGEIQSGILTAKNFRAYQGLLSRIRNVKQTVEI